jgi:hypothetical protein
MNIKELEKHKKIIADTNARYKRIVDELLGLIHAYFYREKDLIDLEKADLRRQREPDDEYNDFDYYRANGHLNYNMRRNKYIRESFFYKNVLVAEIVTKVATSQREITSCISRCIDSTNIKCLVLDHLKEKEPTTFAIYELIKEATK